MVLLKSETVDFRTRHTISDIKRKFHNDRVSSSQTLYNPKYVYNNTASKHMKKKHRTERRNTNFNTLFLIEVGSKPVRIRTLIILSNNLTNSQHNTHVFQLHMVHSPRRAIGWHLNSNKFKRINIMQLILWLESN